LSDQLYLLKSGDHCCGIISRAVVHHNYLVRRACLRQNAHNRIGEKARLIEGWDNDSNGRAIAMSGYVVVSGLATER
jgi:hypothetical protein